MNRDNYLTICKLSRHEIPKIKGSRFIGTVSPAVTREEAEKFIESQRKEFHNATHNCWAYRLGGVDLFRFNDDGEPSGTAGRPILQAIEAKNLHYILIVVTRYFGGTKLGPGGLIRAYHKAAAAVLDQSEIISKALFIHFRIHHDFDQTNPVMNLSSKYDARILASHYDSQVRLDVALKVRAAQDFIKNLIDATGGKIEYESLGRHYA